ncbi:MAG: hypothetical protein BWY61_00773 [Firmicutes bacterium ADurb.Bin354]|nr:MAG: hypothetical protein BWY61_00773 [Firmicutes bacterium ADurb.Bin354]
MNHHLGNNCASLDDTCIRSKITLKYSDTSVRHIRIINRTDNFRIPVFRILNILGNSLACNRDEIRLKKSLLIKLMHYSIYPSGLVKVFHICRTGRSKMTEIRSFCRNLICDLHIDLNTCFMCNRRDMKHCICGASKRHINSKRVHESILSQDIPGTDILLKELHNLITGCLRKTDTSGINSGDRAVSAKSHTDSFRKAVH